MNNFITLLEVEGVRELIRNTFAYSNIDMIYPEMLLAAGYGDAENALKILKVLCDQKVLEGMVDVYSEDEKHLWSGSTDAFTADQLSENPTKFLDPNTKFRLKFLMSAAWKEAILHTLHQESLNEINA